MARERWGSGVKRIACFGDPNELRPLPKGSVYVARLQLILNRRIAAATAACPWRVRSTDGLQR